jgi:hypothetical protein
MISPISSLHTTIGWLGIVLGLIAGAVLGLFFDQDDWLGGYSSWPRRMLRLGHISFVGIGLLNLAFVSALSRIEPGRPLWIPSLSLMVAEVAMPFTCFLAAVWRRGRYLFPIPVIMLLAGAISTLLWIGTP